MIGRGRRAGLVLTVALALATVGCADHSAHTDDAIDAQGGGVAAVPGSPADASDATRTIEIEASDTLRFDPASIDIAVRETVTFVIHNGGDDVHEFALGNSAYQEEHEADMEGEHHTMTDNAVSVEPGDTAELTWVFDEVGEVMYGCHEAGHYAGGMVGTITVS